MKRIGKLGTVLIALAGATFAGFMLTILLAVAIWPGEAKLTAPLLCPDDQPDAFVVTDTYSSEPGETTTNFTLYCVGPRGDATDAGFAIPILLLTAAHTSILVVLFVLLGLRNARKVARRHPGLDMADAIRAEQATIDVGGEPPAAEVAPIPPADPPEGTIPPGPLIS